MPESYAYILRNRPYRDRSLLLDIFTQENGRISCIANPTNKRGKIIVGMLQPFRYLHLQWRGYSEVVTLIQADEQGRHNIPSTELLQGLYLNELLLSLTQQHFPLPELFNAYKQTLHRITKSDANPQALMRFELFLLQTLGYEINLYCDDASGEVINPQASYRYIPLQGIIKNTADIHQDDGFILSSNLLIALRNLEHMQEKNWQELRGFLDRLIRYIAGKSLHSRRFL
ncbi:MAG TPA: DNA repair protein RecO [Leucothrix mucor]|uniref:DNA repair protein RecO n=1 Tax=Leucothrix mucor TaxID=45248 RepID=A0A7V2T2B4_LEUMU|nr:DNA repair protein RecO [Leucothrix mucor]